MNFYYKIIYDKIIYYRSHFGSSLVNMYSNMRESCKKMMNLYIKEKKREKEKKYIIFEPVFYIKITQSLNDYIEIIINKFLKKYYDDDSIKLSVIQNSNTIHTSLSYTRNDIFINLVKNNYDIKEWYFMIITNSEELYKNIYLLIYFNECTI
jgi:hypothetical protein